MTNNTITPRDKSNAKPRKSLFDYARIDGMSECLCYATDKSVYHVALKIDALADNNGHVEIDIGFSLRLQYLQGDSNQ